MVINMNQVTDATALRVKASEKKMINSKADVNQLVPFKYPWAWSMYLKSCENHWMPQETRLPQDPALAARLTSAPIPQVNIIMDMLQSIGTRPMVVGKDFSDVGKLYDEGMNLLFMYRHNTAPECRQYLLRQGFEEAIKAHLYNYICEALPEMHARNTVLVSENTLDLVYSHNQDAFSTIITENAIKYIKFLIENVIIQKGCVDLAKFQSMVMVKDVFPELFKLFGFVFRDSMNHVQFAIRVINTIFEENPQLDRYDPEISASFDFGKVIQTSQYARSCYDEYRMAIQPTYKPSGFVPSASFNSDLDLPIYKQHLDETNHNTTHAVTSVDSLEWE